MFKKEELEKLFNNAVSQYSVYIEGIIFTLNMEMLGIEDEKYWKHSRFELGHNGLLELSILADGGILEYDKKIKNLDDLKYAIDHLDEWEDDWNQ